MVTPNDGIAKLRKDVEHLRSDVAALLDSFEEAGIGVRHDAVNRARQTGESLREGAEELQRQAEAKITERPFTSVLTAFGLGFLIGMILDRRR